MVATSAVPRLTHFGNTILVPFYPNLSIESLLVTYVLEAQRHEQVHGGSALFPYIVAVPV